MAARKKAYVSLLITALAKGATVAQAAAQAGVSERTVYRRLADKEFQDQIEALQDEMLQRAVAMLTAAAQEGIRSLVDLQNEATPPAVRRSAARDILEMGMRLREAAELEKRLIALESRATGNDESFTAPAPIPAASAAPPPITRRRGNHTLLMALACGASVAQAAAKAGISERTAYRRLSDPRFRARIETLRGEMVQRAAALLIAAAIHAAKTLIDLQNSATPAAVRRRAARDILELSERLREATVLEKRLAALESRME
jgi:AcrR family transcriptional regulator